MPTARVIQTKQGQTVHLPADVHLAGSHVDVIAKDDGIVELRPAQVNDGPESGLRVYELLLELSELIGDPPEDPPPQDRPDL